jgi:LacI family transcriptional regulator
MDVASTHPRSSVLSVDYRAGILEGVAHLAALGHRRLGFISGPLRLLSATARKQAFLESLRAHGIKSNASWLVEGDHTLDGGRDAMQKILAQKQWPTAVMCSNDMTAIGVQHALFEAGLKVPDDFSLIGFDDIHLAEYTIPPLTTVRMACVDLARKAVACLLSHVEPNGSEPETAATISTRLIVRETTGPPRSAFPDPARPLAHRPGKR